MNINIVKVSLGHIERKKKDKSFKPKLTIINV